MKKIILFYGSFDPIHKGHLKIASEALKLINGDELYFGINKNSKSKNLTPFSKRKKMIELSIKNKNKFKFIDIKFDFKNIEKTYSNLFNYCSENNEYYLLIGDEQIKNLPNWHNFDLIKSKFKFIIANRNSDINIRNNDYIYINNKVNNISSSEIREGCYKHVNDNVKKYIIENNIYLEKQIEKYLSKKRLKHVKSVKNLALKIYKSNKIGLNKNKVITAALLHDVAREYSNIKLKYIIKKYYSDRIDEQRYIFHQYAGEYIAQKKFNISDATILEAIKYHTTANENMSKLAKLIYVSDKLDPLRPYDTSPLISICIDNLDLGFIEVLKDKLNYSIKKDEIKTMSSFTKKALNYYLKGEIKDVGIDY